jgi:hypothetical protein
MMAPARAAPMTSPPTWKLFLTAPFAFVIEPPAGAVGVVAVVPEPAVVWGRVAEPVAREDAEGDELGDEDPPLETPVRDMG